eukprot:TRINITY_DN34352_c0_g1_i1.p1 TRINITY_DN34352_c0_g1~~TRINITY_DN34352_c0_g1_i1.p1  ORF type:complete len:821 (+),score=105.29 TRINITY_DN34352_c0_g1_i1:85-2463(+)
MADLHMSFGQGCRNGNKHLPDGHFAEAFVRSRKASSGAQRNRRDGNSKGVRRDAVQDMLSREPPARDGRTAPGSTPGEGGQLENCGRGGGGGGGGGQTPRASTATPRGHVVASALTRTSDSGFQDRLGHRQPRSATTTHVDTGGVGGIGGGCGSSSVSMSSSRTTHGSPPHGGSSTGRGVINGGDISGPPTRGVASGRERSSGWPGQAELNHRSFTGGCGADSDLGDRGLIPRRPTTPCLRHGVDGQPPQPRPTTSCLNYASGDAVLQSASQDTSTCINSPPQGASHSDPLPPRPTTPCPSNGRSKSKRLNSAGSSSRHGSRGRPTSVSVISRISELESALLARHSQRTADGEPLDGGCLARASNPARSDSRTGRASSCVATGDGSKGRLESSRTNAAPFGGLGAHPASLTDEAETTCRGALTQTANASLSMAAAEDRLQGSPRHFVERPDAPTPEQTSHWLQDMEDYCPASETSRASVATTSKESKDGTPYGSCGDRFVGKIDSAASSRSPSPGCHRHAILMRPRSPTPTKMLAWEEDQNQSGRATAVVGEHSDREGRGDHADGLISELMDACQRNNVERAFAQYEKLQRMRIPLYEGVYKLIIECCTRTHNLGQAMRFYETIKGSGQRISTRLAILLMEACAREQHGDKVQAIWRDWCPPHEAVTSRHSEVLLVAVSALIRTMCPDLARDVLRDAMRRTTDDLVSCFAHCEIEIEDLFLLNEAVADEARANGTLLEGLAESFRELHETLHDLRQRCLRDGSRHGETSQTGILDDLLMEDLDVDLVDLAAH